MEGRYEVMEGRWERDGGQEGRWQMRGWKADW